MTPTMPAPEPSPFTCRDRSIPFPDRRHKVIGLTPDGDPDGICVICGARNVIDARLLPALPAPTTPPPPTEPPALAAFDPT